MRRTGARLTKYEYARLIGTRADQISRGAPVLVSVPWEVTNPLDIAKLELEQKKIPLIVRRYLPGGEFEDCDANALLLPWPDMWSPNTRVSAARAATATALRQQSVSGTHGRGRAGDSGRSVSLRRRHSRGVKRLRSGTG